MNMIEADQILSRTDLLVPEEQIEDFTRAIEYVLLLAYKYEEEHNHDD